MINVTEADVGRKVIYKDASGRIREEGMVTSWNGQYAFVRFGSGSTSAACRPDDLEWSFPSIWCSALADFVVLGVGYRHWRRMNAARMKRYDVLSSFSKEDFVADIRARIGKEEIVPYLIGRLVKGRLDLPEDYNL